MRPPRLAPLAAALALVVSCAKADKTNDSAAGAVSVTPSPTPAPAAAPAPALSLADVAGKWTVVATPLDGKDPKTTTITLNAKADTAGWTQAGPDGRQVPLHVQVSGDSIITHAGPYDSFRRKGVKVTTDGVWRLQGGKLVGTTTAHYIGAGADSLLHLRSEGTKAP